jgi:uncharacterized protein DUF4304
MYWGSGSSIAAGAALFPPSMPKHCFGAVAQSLTSLSAIAAVLKPEGFKRRGKVLRALSDDIAKVVEFQKSDESNAQRILFTVNLGIVCGQLLDQERAKLRNSTSIDAHLRTRLGMLLSTPDIWWELAPSTDWEAVTRELSQLLVATGLPYLNEYGSARDLVALWESGKSPGLTATQRAWFFSQLK